MRMTRHRCEADTCIPFATRSLHRADESESTRRRAPAAVAPDYALLAPIYDRLVGHAMLPAIREGFERCVQSHGIGFRSAADVGCGTGAFLAYLLRYRVPLYGVDRSPAMLRFAAARLRGRGVRLLRQDIRRLALPRPVDLITCTGDTLNYLADPGDFARALGRLARNLNRGGHLIADLLTGIPPAGTRAQRLAPSWLMPRS